MTDSETEKFPFCGTEHLQASPPQGIDDVVMLLEVNVTKYN